MYSLKDKEGTIINNVREDFFKDYDCRKLIGNIDFSVAIPQTGKELFPEIEYLLWAEAKKGSLSNSAFHDAFIQLIFTIGRERTFDKNLPPKFLGAFDAEKIAFIPFSAVMEVFSQNDFDWTVAPSDHESKEFKQLKEMVKKQLTETGKENENVYFFNFFNDKRDLQRFIKRNFVSGRDSVQRMRITYNNFTHIYEKWRKEVMPSIAVNWDNAKKNGLLDADFYLADIMSGDNETLLENLHVLLKSNHYELDRKIDTDGLWASKSVPFNDNMAAHSRFWSKYTRPPKKEYWDKIVERRDLLVPQDIRERKGSYFTPRIWVEKVKSTSQMCSVRIGKIIIISGTAAQAQEICLQVLLTNGISGLLRSTKRTWMLCTNALKKWAMVPTFSKRMFSNSISSMAILPTSRRA